MGSNGYETYQRAEVLSSSPEQLVPLLYRELLRQLSRGKVAMQESDLETKADAMGRAQAIVLELLAHLDVSKGGELGHKLASLYRYFLSEIEGASRHLEIERLQRLIDLIGPLAEAWEHAADEVSGKPTGAGI